MVGFAISALGWTPAVFWSSTPIEYNAGTDFWIRMNVPEEERNKIGGFSDTNPWEDQDLVNRAKELMALSE